MREPSNEEKAVILGIWQAAYENLADNMRQRGMWQITLQNIDALVVEMGKKAQALNDSKP